MAAVVYKITAKIPSVSGDVDEMENVWAWAGDSSVSRASIAGDLNNFYKTDLSPYLGDELSRSTGGVLTFYDITAHLDGSPAGAPVDMINLDPISGPEFSNSLPGQIAVVVDYHGDLTGVVEFGVHARPRARHRGRHYYGPIVIGGYEQDGTTRIGRWGAALVTQMNAAHHNLLASAVFGPGWAVWSRKDATTHPVIGGWTDTTPHRARRREEPTNIKSFWS